MIRLALALAALLALTSPVQHIIATGPVELVPGVLNLRTYSCGFVLAQKGQSLDFRFWSAKAGTGCLEEVTALTPVFSLPSDVVMVNRLENVGPYTPPGHSLCIETTGSQGQLTGIIYWMQF